VPDRVPDPAAGILVSAAELFGDGVFETVHLRPSGPWLLDAHLDRLARSAALLDLPLPPRAEVASRVAAAIATSHGAAETRSASGFAFPGAVETRSASGTTSRGAEETGSASGTTSRRAEETPSASGTTSRRAEETPSAHSFAFRGAEAALRIIATRVALHVTVAEIPEAVRRERREGIRLISADCGVGLGRHPPWSLTAAKSLSYASNFAARRWAARQGADDLLWLTTEGYALEAPTASLVWLDGDTLCTVPPGRADILPGTTAAHLLSIAPSLGLRGEERMVTIAELAGAHAIWLASALRGLAEVMALDGTARPRSPWTPKLLARLGYERGVSAA
jgi:4-amino-4-deoxychorismate lyase